ncbi:MAG: signal recognition particle-docking protein FtsY [Deltaproteobacteria bacterium]|nr:signal recognition particle-docking protein FtsY [Deltaproteobacteria bacterium]
MTGNEILIVLALLGLGATAWVVLRRKPEALPPAASTGGALGSADPASDPAQAPALRSSNEVEPDSSARETVDDEEAARPPLADPDASTHDDDVSPLADPEAPTRDDAVSPLLGPDAPGRSQPVSSVPLPVDKPKSPARDDDDKEARRAAERKRYRDGLAKTRGGFMARLSKLLTGKPKVDDDLRDRIEEVLFTADIGTTTAEKLQQRVTTVLDRKDVADPDAVWAVIRQAMLELLELPAEPLHYDAKPAPYVLLMIGVNGVGKTTTLGKLAAQHVRAGRRVLLVAGDTFRAAAVEQLDVWARRVGCTLHQGTDKADPSSVIFDGIARGRREGFDVVLCDTAGRLHTRTELMDELAKVGRAAAKARARGLPAEQAAEIHGAHDTFLVLDATIGQNALAQAKLFKETMDFTGLVVTKLDGTAKGGVVLGICDELAIPIRYIGIGEGIDDLRAFDAQDFADALLVER